MTQLYLIRHGQAHSNVNPVMAGMRGDTGLTDLGIQQAERLRDRLAQSGEIKADVLIASDLPRAAQTAGIIAPAFGLPIMFDPEVQEFNPGEADGMSVAEAETVYDFATHRDNQFHPIAPGGDSFVSFVTRVGRALHRITTEYKDKSIVIVCHGGVIDMAFVYFFGLSSLARPQVEFYTFNTSITYWEHKQRDENEPHRWRLVRYNDDAHLKELGVRN